MRPMPRMRTSGRRGSVSGMGAVIAVPHVGHGQKRPRVKWRYWRAQALAHRQGATDIAGAGVVLGKDRESILAGRLDDHVECFSGGDPKLIHCQRMHILPIDFDDRHFQTWDTHIKIGHGRPGDDTQPDLLTRAKDRKSTRLDSSHVAISYAVFCLK